MTTETTENTTTTESTAGITAHPDRAAAIARLAARRAAEQGIVQETEPAPPATPAQPTASAEDDGLDNLERQAAAEEYGAATSEPDLYGAATSEPDLYGELFDAYEEGDTDRFREVMQRRDRKVQNEILSQVERQRVTQDFVSEYSDLASDRDLLAQANAKIIELQKAGLPLEAAARQAGTEVRRTAQSQGRLRATRDSSTASAIAAMKRARGLPT